jgi:peptidoglycan LD-endopeptidase CwlK
MDKTTQDNIMKLHPSVRVEVTNIINEINTQLTGSSKVRISQGLRTFAEQDALFAQGRTKKGKIVTDSKAGQSIHNYGFAVDIVLIINGKEASWDTHKDWDNDGIADWDECVKIFAKWGWSWGGNWNTFKDMPHFDKIGYNNWRVLAAKKRDSNNYIII